MTIKKKNKKNYVTRAGKVVCLESFTLNGVYSENFTLNGVYLESFTLNVIYLVSITSDVYLASFILNLVTWKALF